MSSVRARLRALTRGVRRAVLRRRRLLAALCALVAVLAGLRATAAPPPTTTAMTVAAHDLAAGTKLSVADVSVVEVPADLVPVGHLRDPVGRTIAGPLRRGTPVTDAALLGPDLVDGRPDLVVMPVRLPDTAMAGLLRVGDEIDLVAADPQGGPASTVARQALVLALPPPPGDAAADGLPGRLVVLGIPQSDVTSVSSATVTHFLTIVWSG